MPDIRIQSDTCIRCKKCIRICPSELFSLEADKKVTVHADGCISCGHCVAVCPTESIFHTDFPSDKIHGFDRACLPTSDAVTLLIKSRRSNRAFSARPIPEEKLQNIIEAAHRAPTATNAQEVKMVLVTNQEVLLQISRITLDTFMSVVRKAESPFLKPLLKPFLKSEYRYIPAFKKLYSEFSQGHDGILREARAALFFYTDKHARFGCQDANLAYQNASLMAEAEGVAHFYTGFVCTAAGMNRRKEIQHLLGIDGKIHAGIAMGMPLFRFERYIDKHELELKRID